MAFTQSSRIWWDTTQPGASTSELEDSAVNSTAATDNASGTVGLEQGRMIICARSGFEIPLTEAVQDPVTGNLVWNRFVDPPPLDADDGLTVPSDGTHNDESN